MITARNVTKVFGTGRGREKAAVLDEVSFEVDRGSVYVLLGPSGCGKTTLLRCLAGIETPDSGRVAFDDRVMFDGAAIDVPPHRRGVGLVFQSYAIWPHMSVSDNVAYPLRNGPVRPPRDEVARRVEEVLDLVGLRGMSDRSATQLSGGQQQRVAVARALIHRPRVLLMDEPLSNLDAQLRRDTREQLAVLLREVAATTVYVTHDQVEAMAMADVLAIMNHGRIVQAGTANDVYWHPRDEFVGRFVGDMNLVEGVVRGRDGKYVSVGTDGGILWCHDDVVNEGERVVVGIRPAALRLADGHGTQPVNALEATVLRLDLGGEVTKVELRWGAVPLDMVVLAHSPDLPLQIGDAVNVVVSPDACSVFASAETRSDDAAGALAGREAMGLGE